MPNFTLCAEKFKACHNATDSTNCSGYLYNGTAYGPFSNLSNPLISTRGCNDLCGKGWFVFALSLSIADAFGQVGDNQTAHDLAIGLLLAWLPVFVIATIVDRNPIGAESIRRKLNEFVDDVRRALLDPTSREAFLAHYRRCEEDLAWKNLLDIEDFYNDGFFVRFAGQGVAHSITAVMETAHIAAHGRDWLENDCQAEDSIIWAPVKFQGLFWFDFRMVWQMMSSIIAVGGTLLGAFILSCEQSPKQLYPLPPHFAILDVGHQGTRAPRLGIERNI
ncbi:MAG: hypothetical protein Q9168_000943 [Polycauliona sp. 1 TL-2023]